MSFGTLLPLVLFCSRKSVDFLSAAIKPSPKLEQYSPKLRVIHLKN